MGFPFNWPLFFVLSAVLVLHIGFAYRLHHYLRESSLLLYMGYLMANLGAGLAFAIQCVFIQTLSPQFGGRQAALLTPLLGLPFDGLVPFALLLFVSVHLGKPLDWKYKVGYWIGFGCFIGYGLTVHLWQFLQPDPGVVRLPAPVAAWAGRLLQVLILLGWGMRLVRPADGHRSRRGVLLWVALALPALLFLVLEQMEYFDLVVLLPSAKLGDQGSLPLSQPISPYLAGAESNPIPMALFLFWGGIPGYWVLKRFVGLSRPEAPESATRIYPDLACFGLSPREVEVAKLVMAGHSNKEIGEKLFISLDTVKRHITNAYRKTGVKNRVQLSHLRGPDRDGD